MSALSDMVASCGSRALKMLLEEEFLILFHFNQFKPKSAHVTSGYSISTMLVQIREVE